jgi:hypothetical protein
LTDVEFLGLAPRGDASLSLLAADHVADDGGLAGVLTAFYDEINDLVRFFMLCDDAASVSGEAGFP